MGTRQAKKLRKQFRKNLAVSCADVLDMINALPIRQRYSYAWRILFARKIKGRK